MLECLNHNPPDKKGFKLLSSSSNAIGRGLRSSSGTVAPRNRKGFNLIEAAVVLALVGAVIGAIWWAASAVSENMKVTRTMTAYQEIYRESLRLFPRQSYSEADTHPGQNMDVTTTVIAAGVPADLVRNGQPVNPFGGTWGVQLNGETHVEMQAKSIVVALYNVQKSVCIKIVQSLLAMRGSGGIIGIWSSAYGPNHGWWITPSNLTATKTLDDVKNQACNASTVTFSAAFTL